jgi:Na+-driven multidrug efflux pump
MGGGLGLAFVAMALMLALTIATMRVVSHLFEPNDPKRAMAIRAVLWIGTAILIVILLELRQ